MPGVYDDERPFDYPGSAQGDPQDADHIAIVERQASAWVAARDAIKAYLIVYGIEEGHAEDWAVEIVDDDLNEIIEGRKG